MYQEWASQLNNFYWKTLFAFIQNCYMYQPLKCKGAEHLKLLFFMKGCSSSQILFITIYYCIYTTYVYGFSKHSGGSSIKISSLRERMRLKK
jgi:hypothetical protein